MRRQPFKFLTIVAVSVLIVMTGGLFLKKGYYKFVQHKTHRLNELLAGHTPYNVIYLGSSRTHTTIDPGIIDSLLHIRSFNAGVEGGRMPELEMMLNAYLQNHPPPQYLVLTVDADFIAHGKATIFYPIQYFDYAQNKAVKKVLEADGYHMGLYQRLPFLQVASWDDMTRSYALKGWSGKTDIDGAYDRQGYLSNGSVSLADPVVPKTLIDTDGFSRAKSSFLNIISTCRQSSIGLIFTYAPQYNPGDTSGIEGLVTYRYADSLSRAENIPFLKHQLLPMCSDRLLFANVGHVNQAGGRIYGPILADALRQIMGDLH